VAIVVGVLIFLVLVLLHGLGPLACAHSVLINSEIWILQTVGMTPYAGDQPVEMPVPTEENTNTEETRTDIHTSSGIRNHDPSV
jgi:hypothetical protein